jgi:Multicopper oxidase
MLQAERNATSVLLTNWTHVVSDDTYEQYFETGGFPHCADSLLANGLGRVQCLPENVLQAGPGLGLDPSAGGTPASSGSSMVMPMMRKRQDMAASSDATTMDMEMMTMTSSMSTSMSMSHMSTMPPMSSESSTSGVSGMSGMSGDMSALDPRGCSPPMMFRPGYNIDSLPLSTCTNTTSDLLKIPANTTQGWLSLNLVNAASVAKMSVSLDGHSMYVYAADGLFVGLQEVQVLQISVGQRYSVMIKLDQTIGEYYLRFATYPWSDMQQVMQGQAIVSYEVSTRSNLRCVICADNLDGIYSIL